MSIVHTYTSPVADATGTLTVWAGSTTASVAASNVVQPGGWNAAHALIQPISGNTAGVSSVSGTNIVLAGGNNMTLSGIQGANAATISFSGAASTGLVGTGTTFGGTNVSGSMTLNSAGLALSLSAGAGGAGSLTVSAGASSAALDAVVFSNSNGVSFGLNGSTITGTVVTTYVQPGFTTATTAGTAIVGTLSTAGLSMGVPAFITTARASNDGIGLNTAQTNVTWTVNSSGISLNAAGYAGTGTTFGGTNISGSITQNSAGIALSLSGLAALTSQSNQALSAANGSFAFQTASFSNVNGASFVTAAGSAMQISIAPPTLALTNLSGTTSADSAGHTISLSAAAAGGGNTISYFVNGSWQSGATMSGVTQSTSIMFPVIIPQALSMNFMRLIISMSTNSTSLATTANTTLNGVTGSSYNVVVYSQGVGANSSVLRYLTSTQFTALQTMSLQANSNGSEWTWAGSLTYPAGSGLTSQFLWANSVSQTRYDFATTAFTDFTGTRFHDVPFALTLPASNLWVAIGISTSTAQTVGTGGTGMTRFLIAYDRIGALRQNNDPVNILGSATNSSIGLLWGLGNFSTAAGGTTASVEFSRISTIANHPIPLVQFIGQA